ncbi:50S ribosomal protein L18 [Methanophagales archaeon]|nr:MAG: 50S ribosomal protein L18 [Methanophagales archaeon]
MAKSPTHHVPFRRRREGKTDYRKRLKLLLSEKPRVVVRESNKYIRIQLVLGDNLSDRTVISTISSELEGYGYEGGKCNTSAAYLTGLLFGRKSKEAGFDEGILDIGQCTPTHGSKVYAALKGVVDSGMDIPYDPSVLPSDERLNGQHIAEFLHNPAFIDNFNVVKEKISLSTTSIQEERTKAS